MTQREPTCIHATVREAIGEDGEKEWHIECRFDDGQKFAAICVDGGFEQLAHRVAAALAEMRKP